MPNNAILNSYFSSFRVALFRLFAWRNFVFLFVVFSSFHLFAWRLFIISTFLLMLLRFFAWHLFVISSFHLASFRYLDFLPSVFLTFPCLSSCFRGASFRLLAWRYFAYLRGVFSSFCLAFSHLFAWLFFFVIFLFAWRIFLIRRFA